MKITMFCFLFVMCFINDHLAQKQADTLWIPYEHLQACSTSMQLTASGGKYYFNSKEITEQQFRQLNLFYATICDSIVYPAAGHYCKFYVKDSVIIEEGRWHLEFFSGPYKNYYPDGKIKTSGQYAPQNSPDSGKRIGTWIVYNRKGRVKKAIHYKSK